MRYVIMADGEGKRWNNYLGIPKHLVEINGEPLIARTVRLLKENNVDDIIITSRDERYNFASRVEQSVRECEIDRFDEKVINGEEICYLYGDVYYTEDAIKTIVKEKGTDIQFFGHENEIFAIKIRDIPLFLKHKNIVKKLYLDNKIKRCIGWEIYRSLHNIPFEEHKITTDYIKILDGTDDIDYPVDYENFKQRMEKVQ